MADEKKDAARSVLEEQSQETPKFKAERGARVDHQPEAPQATA